VQQPRTPAEREKALSDLYAHLATAADEQQAKTVANSIERLWMNAGGDTVLVLMERAAKAAQAKQTAQALRFLDAVVDLAPDFTEGWHRRARLHYMENNIELALGDLRRVLALDPNHFEALEAMAHVLKEIDQKRGALAAVRKLLEVHPFAEGAKQLQDELARAVEGQAL
jgi:tetratricopeptide (TPR) repeat protein